MSELFAAIQHFRLLHNENLCHIQVFMRERYRFVLGSAFSVQNHDFALRPTTAYKWEEKRKLPCQVSLLRPVSEYQNTPWK